MPRYFFHVHDGSEDYPDEEGLECPDLNAVREKALEGARDLVCEEVAKGRIDLSGAIQVFDERGERVLLLPFSETVEVISLGSS